MKPCRASRAVARGVLACSIAAILATAARAQAPTSDATAVRDRQTIMRSISQGWLESQGADGFLPYGFDFLADRATDNPTSPGYVIRQAGALYAWASFMRYSRDERLRMPIAKGIEALAGRSLAVGKSRTQEWLERTRILSSPIGRWKISAALEKFGLLYQPTGTGKLVSGDGKYTSAHTAATAFALLAELTYSNASGDNRFADLRSSWRDGLLALRIPGAGFREGPTSIDASDYYDGEAWLALAVYADLNRNDETVQRELAEVDRALMQHYAEHPSNAFYSWGALSAAQRWRTTSDPRFVDFIKQQAEVFVDRFERELDPDTNYCSPMEGLAASLGVLGASPGADSPLARRIRTLLVREDGKLPKLQIRSGQTQLQLGGTAYLSTDHLSQFRGGFLMGRFAPVTRVDAAQHCLSALIAIEEQGLLRGEKALPSPAAK